MAYISSQSTRSSGSAQNYAKKDAVAISAIGAPVQMFEQRLQQTRVMHGKDGVQAKTLRDEDGKVVRDKNGDLVRMTYPNGDTVYEGKYVEAYSLVQSFGHDELDPDDPASWERAQELGRAFAGEYLKGHPALIATEVNGRSGCVHNHIILGAIHAETGKSIDSNLVTHSRMTIQHDRILAEHGFEQREDMRVVLADAKERIEQVRAKVIAEEGDTLSPSALKRRILAAENTVQLRSYDEVVAERQQQPLTKEQKQQAATRKREDRRMREFDRYQLREQEREAALDVGVAPPPERFSEIELEARVKTALADPRSRTWDELGDVGREHGVIIARRGSDVTYGMMLAQPDGSLAEPAPAHRRRGKGLGKDFRVAELEQCLERNAERAAAETRPSSRQDLLAKHQAALDAASGFEPANPRADALMAQMKRDATQRADGPAASASIAPTTDEVAEHEPAPLRKTRKAAASSPPVSDAAANKAEQKARQLQERIEAEQERQALVAQWRQQQGLPRAERRVFFTDLDPQARRYAAAHVAHDRMTGATAAQQEAAWQRLSDNRMTEAIDKVERELVEEAKHTRPERDARSTASAPASPVAGNEGARDSRLHGVRAKSGSATMQARIEGLAALEDDYVGRMPSTASEREAFEHRVNEIGVDTRTILEYGEHMAPEIREQLHVRASAKSYAGDAWDRGDHATSQHGKSELYGRAYRIREMVSRGDYDDACHLGLDVPASTTQEQLAADREAYEASKPLQKEATAAHPRTAPKTPRRRESVAMPATPEKDDEDQLQ